MHPNHKTCFDQICTKYVFLSNKDDNSFVKTRSWNLSTVKKCYNIEKREYFQCLEVLGSNLQDKNSRKCTKFFPEKWHGQLKDILQPQYYLHSKKYFVSIVELVWSGYK